MLYIYYILAYIQHGVSHLKTTKEVAGTLKSWCRFCVVKGRLYIPSLSLPTPLEISLCSITEFNICW